MTERLPYEDLLTKNNIWNIRQNKPSLIARDLELFGVPQEVTHKVLLARGVYKWLSVRRQIITLKNIWKDRINITLDNLRNLSGDRDKYKRGYLRGYLKAYEECRGEIRSLCHSERWQAPDFDREANKFLNILGEAK